ncbi:TM2 domain-containing protein [Borreliella burgdorferi]|uniref:TM2 domain-containing protein n=1 Tax=Borreliella burgdorferi TaxID=139 RepID=UPI0018ED8834|nr:NINE protein [Borreliella burgdorferi]
MSKAVDEIYCHSCGKTIKKDAEICISCGVKNKQAENYNKLVVFLLCLFLGYLRVHRFYVGEIGTGMLYLFTFGFLYIGALIDLIRIATNKFECK